MMLYPRVKVCKEPAICTCGAPNFRPFHSNKLIHKVFEVEIPQAPYGSVTFHLCEDCIRKIWKEAVDDETD